MFREKFGSRVLLDPAKYVIETDYIDGPFRYMHSVWSFKDCEEGCEVKFKVDFEFKIGDYLFTIISTKENAVETVKVKNANDNYKLKVVS